MGQVTIFLGWILIGIVTTLISVGLMTIGVVNGAQGFSVIIDPIGAAILASFFLPGIGLLLFGRYLKRMDAKDDLTRDEARSQRQVDSPRTIVKVSAEQPSED